MNTILYFSPTGNAQYIAKILCDHLGPDGTELLPLEFTDPNTLQKAERLIIVYSIHGFNPPRTVNKFVNRIPPGLYNNISLISVGCAESWINYAVTSGLRNILQKKGCSIAVDSIVAMPLTFIMSFPEKVIKKQISLAERKVKQIAQAIIKGDVTSIKIPFKSKIIHAIGKIEGPAARLFGLELHANKKCTSCGVCVKNCPEKNIRFNKKNKPKFSIHCLMCMRCIYNCPEKAISPLFSKFIPIKNGYSILNFLD